ncbi:PREDICTED: E3 ubiquitin-protein ligase RING1-like isoform X1 [Ipomoea nil]|uniref:E3 ubiquitin-protein ligase RING1-like isoform X1 n=1 Tax=Ipomoea nil TaxID=35883 RepID=UPI000900ADA1|nr:PREDICTED: E3 ubiquitin-protein ligase RING1-like isoform X1 [Ipomoea nil]
MASTAATSADVATTTAAATTTQNQQQPHHLQTYWCHECDMSVFLLCPPTPSPARCPHCNSDFLEQMDSFAPAPPPLPPQHSLGTSPSLAPMFVDPSTTLVPSDENFLLDSPYLHRLVHHLTTTNDVFTTANRPHNPTSKSAIQSLQDLQIDSSILDKDPVIPCPICKDLFVLNLEVKMLPCKHMYHSDCILPWLEMNNSCPVCRFRLPPREDEDSEVETLPRGDNFVGAMRLEELMDDDEELFGFQSAIRRIARSEVEALIHIGRRHQTVIESNGSHGTSEVFLLSPTQIGEAGLGVGVARRATSVETVSSLPCCPGDSACEGEVGVSSSRLGEGDAAVRS